MTLVLALLPLVAFYVAESRLGLGTAVAISLLAALPSLGWTWWTTRRLDRLTLGGTAFAAVLGGMSWLSDDPRFVLWTPVLGDAIVAAGLAIALMRGGNPLVAVIQAAKPDETFEDDERAWLAAACWRLAGFTALHGAISALATTGSRELWLGVTGIGGWATMALWLATEWALSYHNSADK